MRTVYFLGAGASKAIDSTLPLASELLPRILEPWKRRDPDRLGLVRDHLRKCHRKLSESVRRLDYESLLGLIETALWANKPLGSHSRADLEEMRKGLLYSLFIILAQAETGVPDDEVLERITPLARLVRDCEGNPDRTIITTNYDILIEYAASQHMSNWRPSDPLPENFINYGIELRYGVGLNSSWDGLDCNPYTPDEKQCVCFKLHGSVNWLYCPECNEVDWMGIRPLAAAEAFAEQWKCCKCRNKYQQLIVPPAIGKSPVYPALRGVWSRALDRLEEAERIVFAGFSLRESDVDIRNLLLLAQSNANSLKEVILVDPAADELMSRYESIYGKHVTVYPPRDWNDYLGNSIPIRRRT